MKKRPYILSIAGFDPSGGAGLMADCKTFEALKCQGLSVSTANTIQTDIEFIDCIWTDITIIEKQITLLFNRFTIDIVKIGIVENWQILHQLIDVLISLNTEVKIVLDPVLTSTAVNPTNNSESFKFQSNFQEKLVDQILSKIYVLTPNYNEIQQLFPDKGIQETIQHISNKTNLFLKGGHHETEKGKDYLHTQKGNVHPINPKYEPIYPKHGSGCVLSSAIASYLALGFPLLKSCFRAKRFTEHYLGTDKGLLGRFK